MIGEILDETEEYGEAILPISYIKRFVIGEINATRYLW